MSVSIINEVLSGNVKAYEVIRDTIGEKPVDININKNIEENKEYSKLSVEELKKVSRRLNDT